MRRSRLRKLTRTSAPAPAPQFAEPRQQVRPGRQVAVALPGDDGRPVAVPAEHERVPTRRGAVDADEQIAPPRTGDQVVVAAEVDGEGDAHFQQGAPGQLVGSPAAAGVTRALAGFGRPRRAPSRASALATTRPAGLSKLRLAGSTPRSAAAQ